MTYPIQNKTEKDEREYLETIKQGLQKAIQDTDKAVNRHAAEVQESKKYLWENKTGMDHVEKVAVRQSITQTALTGESAAEKKKRLAKLIRSPYFGRVDFAENGPPEPIYIGIHTFFDPEQNNNLIHDWRAPISSMFYDFELGKAHYQAPSGRIEGEISRKRQFRIRDGKMEFMLESSLNIHDDVLQKELSQNASEKMKNIVATIQRDQNAIIRDEDAHTLIIQGVAGSGKTSIALHRVAFLLYRFKESIKSNDILILSPNKVFADYISNVLPELGEEKIPETSMEELANDLLEKKYKFQSFFDQVARLMEKNNEKYKERLQYKSSQEFMAKLNKFCLHVENTFFTPETFMVKRYPIPDSYIQEIFQTYHRLPLFKRIPAMARDIANDLNFFYQHQVTATERNEIRKKIEKMFKTTNLRNLYKEFYQWLGRPDLLKQAKGSVYEYPDVFPLVYLKMKLEGARAREGVKHLIVDEMQDYTPLQYNVLLRLFPCKKTILGDRYQSVNPYSSSDAGLIQEVFPGARVVKMNKSYRSTFEITEFARKIHANPELEAMERHGPSPTVKKCKDQEEEREEIRKKLKAFSQSPYKTLGIICKTQQQAEELHQELKGLPFQVHHLDSQSVAFVTGIVITSAHMAKGLEFDQVIVPGADSKNYKTETDQQMLYVACTRAMHVLNITCTGQCTGFLG